MGRSLDACMNEYMVDKWIGGWRMGGRTDGQVGWVDD